MSQVCGSDGSFGPVVGACRGSFDFTLTFEESVLGLLPHALFLLLAPVRLMTLRNRRARIAKKTHLGFLKLVASTMYAASSILLLALWTQLDTFKTKMSITSASFEFLASLFIVLLSRMEHSRAVRPSHLLQFFLLVSFVCDAVKLRTLFLMKYDPAIGSSTSVHTALTGILLLLESLSKKDLLISEHDRRLSPEETVGLFGERLFWHLNGLLKEGYRRILRPKDLHTVDSHLISEELRDNFQRHWEGAHRKGVKHALWRSIASVLRQDLLLPVLPRLLFLGTTLAQPFLISTMVSYVQRPVAREARNEGYGLLAAFALNYIFQAIFSSWYTQSVARFSVKLRSVLVSSIYHKALQINSQTVNTSSATVLMNVDVEKVLLGVQDMHELWAVMAQAAIALYILYTNIGVVFIAPLLVVLLSTLLSSGIGGNVRQRQIDWVAATEKRVTAISHVAASVKEIRMLGLTGAVHKTIESLRVSEVAAHRHVRKLLTVVIVVSNFISQISLFATYITFAVIALLNGTSLDFHVLFKSLSALKLVISPIMALLQQIPTFQSATASVYRIQVYLDGGLDSTVESATEANCPDSDGAEHIALRVQSRGPKQFQVVNGAFGVSRLRPLLHNINLDITDGDFTMIIGKIGSGKSFLLHSLIGETMLLSGELSTGGTGISFCAQSAWLRNASLRENILGESEFEHSWYQTVIWACGLERDFKELSKGDATMVGSRGISLSGGQKNRISLARALYARKPVLIVDDILSGLDNTTETLVFSRIFGRDGLLRKAGTTVVLVTHSVRWAPQSDKLVVMAGGRIIANAPYAELSKNPKFLRENSLQHSDDISLDGPELSQEGHDEVTDGKLATTAAVDVDLELEHGYDRRSGDFRTLVHYVRAVGTMQVAILVTLLAATFAAFALQYVWLKELVEASDSPDSLRRGIVTFTLLTLLCVVLATIAIADFTLVFCPRSSLSLHAQQLDTFMGASFSFIVATDVGSITNRFSQDIVQVDGVLPSAFINTTSNILEHTSNFAILIVATPPIAALLPFLGGVSYLIQRVYLRTSRQMRLMDLEATAPLCTHFLETLEGIATIRAFGWLEAFRARNRTLLDASQAPFYLLHSIQNWLKLVLELMIAGLAVGLRGKIDAGYLGLALVGAMNLGSGVRMLVTAWTELETALSAVARIRLFAATTPQEEDGQRASLTLPPSSWPEHGAIEFRNVSASYHPPPTSSSSSCPGTAARALSSPAPPTANSGAAAAAATTSTPAIRAINLCIAAGEKLAICGRTGSGKSSLVAALFGLLHLLRAPKTDGGDGDGDRDGDGRIYIDGVPIDGVPLAALRARITALPQEPFFLGRTVREELAPWALVAVAEDGEEEEEEEEEEEGDGRRRPTDGEMVDALRKVQLWEKLEQAVADDGTWPVRAVGLTRRSGLDVPLDNVDGLLSRGEKQLFFLARAMLQPGRIVVLDEATSSVDMATAELMQSILRTAFADRTIIAIAHRLNTILDFDRVVVMDRGEIVEVGPPGTLLESENSIFKALITA